MITSSATPLAAPAALVLTDDGDESVADLIPVNALLDGSGNPILDSNNQFILT